MLVSNSAFSQELGCQQSYGFRADANGKIGTTICSSKVDAFLDALDNFSLSNLQYTNTSAATAQGRINDVNMTFKYDANSNKLEYNFPQLGISGSETGASRPEAQQKVADTLKKTALIGLIMNYQAYHSPTSPITGVGGSIPMAGAADFSNSFDTSTKVTSVAGASGSGNNLIGVGVGYGSYNVSGSADKVSTVSMPLSYTIRNDIDPRRQLQINLPITQVTIGQAKSYHGGLGVAYRLPLTDNWTITPSGKYSVVASLDRATLATIKSLSVMSTYVIPLDSYAIAIGNMLGAYNTGSFRSGDYSFSPDVKLKMARNGVMVSSPTSVMGTNLAAELSFIDTRYIGTKPFMPSTQEVGVTLGTNKNAVNARSYTRIGLSYFRGKDTSGFNVNAGFWF